MQPRHSTIPRTSTAESVAVHIRNMIVDGQLPAGERINEVHLARDLGVSRTPLREALARLTHEGALEAIPHIGHYVRPLSVHELEQIYDIRPLLDPEALRLAGLPSRDRLDRLRDLNNTIAELTEPDEIINADDEWHLELIADCPNTILVDLIKQFIRRTHRYELVLMRERQNLFTTMTNHKSVMTALRRGDLEAACDALRTNLQAGKKPIVEWLRKRETGQQQSR